MKKGLLFFCLLLSIFFASCGKKPAEKTTLNQFMEENQRLKILTTTAMIADIAERIGGDKVDVLSLIKGEIDPHSYELVKGDSEKLERADLIFYNGLGLEHGPSLKTRLQNDPKALAVGDAVKALHPEEMLYVDGVIDPHIWLDMALWMHIIEPIKATLIEAKPEFSAYFEEGAKKLHEEMSAVHESLLADFQSIPKEKRFLVTSHDAFNYFTRRYLCLTGDEKQAWETRKAAPEGLAPEGQLSLSDIQRLVDYVLIQGVKVVFSESNVSQDSLKKIVDACRLKGYDLRLSSERLYGDAMRQSDEGYVGMMKHNGKVLVEEWSQNP